MLKALKPNIEPRDQAASPVIELVSLSKWQDIIATIDKRYVRNESLQTLIEVLISVRNVNSVAQGSLLGRPLEPLVKDISLSIHRGSVTGIIDIGGRSRTALLQIMGNGEPPSRGEVRYFGRVAAVNQIGLITFPHMSSREVLKRSARALGVERSEFGRAMEKLPEFSGLGSVLDTPFRRLPKGAFTDIGISFLCCLDYDVLIVDEVNKPSSKKVTANWTDYLKKAPDRDKTVVLTSRNLTKMINYCTHLILIKETQLLDFGLVNDMKARHEAFIEEACRTPMAPIAEFQDLDEEEEDDFYA